MLGEKIKQLRRLRQKTQKELADYLGYSEAQISHIESGNRKVDMDVLRKIIDFFDVNEEYFFSKTNTAVNFRAEDEANNEITNELIEDFRKFAMKKIYGNNGNQK